jgi:hypothetical protein
MMSINVAATAIPAEDLLDLQRGDENLRREAARVIEERNNLGLEGLVGGLQAVIINTELDMQKPAALELIRYSGMEFQEAFVDSMHRTCVLKVPGSMEFHSADFLIRSRLKGTNPFLELNRAIRTKDLPNTRLETFVFETNNIEMYVSLQKKKGVEFQSQIQDYDNYSFIQTKPSSYTGNSLGFIQWKDERGVYSSLGSQKLDWKMEKPKYTHLKNIRWLDHAATRVRAQDRDGAILEFMNLTNYNFDFAIYVKSLNSITSVARLSRSDFAMVFTSGITPYVSIVTSGPTEKFIQNYGPRVHHIAFQTEQIEETTKALGEDGMKYLLDLVGSPEDGLKQIFSTASKNTLLVTEYIHRYGDFDGFFTRSNVASLTAATDKE